MVILTQLWTTQPRPLNIFKTTCLLFRTAHLHQMYSDYCKVYLCFFTLPKEKNLTLLSLSPRVRFFEGVAWLVTSVNFFFLSITVCTPTSLSIFLILFSRHFLWTDKETFFNNQSFLVWKLFPFSIDHNEWFSSINLVINRITWWLLLWVK